MIQDYNKFLPGVSGASRAGGGACMKHRFFVLSSSFFVCAISLAGVVAPAIGGLRITTPGANIKAAPGRRTPKEPSAQYDWKDNIEAPLQSALVGSS